MNVNMRVKDVEIKAPYTREEFNKKNKAVNEFTSYAMEVLNIEDLFTFVYATPKFARIITNINITLEDGTKTDIDLVVFKGNNSEFKKGLLGFEYIFECGDKPHNITMNQFNGVRTFDGEPIVLFEFIHCNDCGVSIGVFTKLKENDEISDKLSKMGEYEYVQKQK